MSDNVHFVLQPPAWSEREAHVCRPLIGTGGESIPWVSVERDRAPVKRGDPDARALVAKAKARLSASTPTWNVVSTTGALFWKRPGMVRAINAGGVGQRPNVMDDLSAELILSPGTLAYAGAQLKSTELIATIPKRGWLVLSAGKPGEMPKMMAVHQIADGVFGRAAPEDALTDTVFFLKAGELAGVSKLKGTSGSLSLMSADEAAWAY